MEHAGMGGEGQQQIVLSAQQLQMLQMNQPTHMLQGSNGQQIMVHTVPSSTPTIQVGPQAIQMASPAGQTLQQIQVVPVSALQGVGGAGNGGQAVMAGGQQAQIVQGADGQTYLYQPVQIDSQHLGGNAYMNINGSLVQVSGVQSASIPQATQQPMINGGNIVMMLSNAGGSSNVATANTNVANVTCEAQDEEPLLYVNARQYRRILRRRQARARLVDLGKIPKERPKYLHESRHRHAMNRVRGEGGRFHSNPDDKSKDRKQERLSDSEKHVEPAQHSRNLIRIQPLLQ